MVLLSPSMGRLAQGEDGFDLPHGAMRGSTGALRMSGGGRTPAGAVEHSPLAELQTVNGGAEYWPPERRRSQWPGTNDGPPCTGSARQRAPGPTTRERCP